MQETPLVSIVTPAYNQAEYLAETIESVLAQDYLNIEYIVIDDGSTDGTAEVLSRYTGRIIHEYQENSGQANTLNRGWAMSTGSLIGYLSSDDLLEVNAVSNLVEALSKRPETVVAYCDFELIDGQGRALRTVRTEKFDRTRLLVDLICQPGPGAIFRREMFNQAGGWKEDLRQVPDFEFWLRASSFGEFIRVPEVLAHYRIHHSSISLQPMTQERSMEIVRVMTDYWGEQSDAKVRKSLAMANKIAAKSHAQSGRYFSTVVCAATAIRLNWRVIFELGFWSSLGSGIFRRTIQVLGSKAHDVPRA